MSPLTYAAISFVLVLGVTLVTAMLLLRAWPAISRQRLKGATPEAGTHSIFRWHDDNPAGWKRLLERVGGSVRPQESVRLGRYRQRLVLAGLHDPRALPLFFGAKVVVAIACALLYPLYGIATQRILPNLLTVSMILAPAGFLLPDLWLRRQIKRRAQQFVHALPDVLDLLMVCVEAGMGFDAAVARVAEQPEMRQSPLHQEMQRMHLEVRAGRPRSEALRAFGDRTGVVDVKAMVSAFVQTDRLGTSLGKTLRIHADGARVRRRHRAEERAYLAPLKMLVPTVVCLMPAFMIVVMAPAFLKLLEVLKMLGSR
jgi:tight adherence protein C